MRFWATSAMDCQFKYREGLSLIYRNMFVTAQLVKLIQYHPQQHKLRDDFVREQQHHQG